MAKNHLLVLLSILLWMYSMPLSVSRLTIFELSHVWGTGYCQDLADRDAKCFDSARCELGIG